MRTSDTLRMPFTDVSRKLVADPRSTRHAFYQRKAPQPARAGIKRVVQAERITPPLGPSGRGAVGGDQRHAVSPVRSGHRVFAAAWSHGFSQGWMVCLYRVVLAEGRVQARSATCTFTRSWRVRGPPPRRHPSRSGAQQRGGAAHHCARATFTSARKRLTGSRPHDHRRAG